jgi:hypothetical protein
MTLNQYQEPLRPSENLLTVGKKGKSLALTTLRLKWSVTGRSYRGGAHWRGELARWKPEAKKGNSKPKMLSS